MNLLHEAYQALLSGLTTKKPGTNEIYWKDIFGFKITVEPIDDEQYIVRYKNGNEYWYKNDKLHREDGPAIKQASGDKYWCKNDQLHREDGPAIVYANGDKDWFKNGLRHRENGPAVEYANGYKEYWKNGKFINESIA